VIVLRAKAVKFDVTYINLREKPDWFLKISPHGKVPVLNVDGEALYESNAIAEFLDETVPPRLHPADPIKRARNRAWTDFLPDFAKGLSGIYYTKSKEEVAKGLEAAPARVQTLEDAIARERGNDGPYFNGKALCIVDAGYAPFFQRFAIADSKLKTGVLDAFPLVKAWSKALLSTDAVTGSVAPEFNEAFVANLKRREFYVGTLFDAKAAAAD
jgi:glutathione S-transferase